MSTYNELEIKQEILNFVRNQDIISVANRGVTTVTDELQSGDGSTISFTPANSGIKNLRDVKLNDVSLTYGSGYEMDMINNKVVVYNSESGTDNYKITYDYGTGDKIYDDFPRADLSLTSYDTGRIGFDILSATTKETGIGGVTNQTNILLQFTLYARDKATLGTMIYTLRDAFAQNKKAFYRFPFINVKSTNNLSKGDTSDDKTIQNNFDIEIPFVFESV